MRLIANKRSTLINIKESKKCKSHNITSKPFQITSTPAHPSTCDWLSVFDPDVSIAEDLAERQGLPVQKGTNLNLQKGS